MSTPRYDLENEYHRAVQEYNIWNNALDDIFDENGELNTDCSDKPAQVLEMRRKRAAVLNKLQELEKKLGIKVKR